MKTELVIDAAGRVVLPQPVRQQFHLTRGSTVELQVGAETIVLRPHARQATLADEGGLLVHEGAPVGDLLAVVERDRDLRDREVAGRLK